MKQLTAYAAGLLLLCLHTLSLSAQRCGNNLNLEELRLKDPERYQRFMDGEAFIASYQKALKTGGIGKDRLSDPNGLIIIPVVVHVLHRGEPEGSGLNISMARIQQQIDILNRDLRRQNPDRVNTPAAFATRGADMGIEFRLACYDPSGNPTNGINRVYAGKESYRYIANEENQTGIKVSSRGGVDPWPTDRYFNIWVCNMTNLYGYATFPDDYKTYPNYDGVVIQTAAFGVTGNRAGGLGRTLSHEVGHWLDLRHIWGDSYCGNDFVDDTPPQTGHSNNACPSYPDRAKLCSGSQEPSAMFMNYMDLTDDACVNLFTQGQRTRARATFATVNGVAGPRAGQLANYFNFIGQPTTISCTGRLRVSALCLPVSWSVSGPAVISSGNGTSQIQLTATGLGPVHVTATAGNYIAETDVTMVDPPPADIWPTRTGCTDMQFDAPEYPGASYQWTVNWGDFLFNGNATTVTTSSRIIQAIGTYGSVSLTASSPCGRSSKTIWVEGDQRDIEGLYQEYICADHISVGVNTTADDRYYRWYVNGTLIKEGSEASRYCTCNYDAPNLIHGGENTMRVEVETGCGMISTPERSFTSMCNYLAATSNVQMYPNPASSQVQLKLDGQHQKGRNGLRDIRQVVIRDKLGVVRKTWTYPKGTVSVTLEVSSLPLDVYYVEVSDGEKKARLPLSIKK